MIVFLGCHLFTPERGRITVAGMKNDLIAVTFTVSVDRDNLSAALTVVSAPPVVERVFAFAYDSHTKAAFAAFRRQALFMPRPSWGIAPRAMILFKTVAALSQH